MEPAPRERVASGDNENSGELLEVTAYLDDAVMLTGLTTRYLSGKISGDLLKRFPDGLRAHTSAVSRELQTDVFLTASRNVYRVRSWRPTAPAPEFGG